MAEIGFGWEWTNFRRGESSRNEPVLIPRAFARKALWGSSWVSQELTLWPNPRLAREFRLRSETVLSNPVRRGLSLRLNLIDEFESEPAANVKRNDLRFLSSLAYSF